MTTHAAARPLRVALVVALVLLATVGLAGPAAAHATLIGSDPADGASLTAAPTTVTLTFDDALAEFEPVVTVTGPDGNQYQSGPATVDGAKLTSAVAPLTAAGAYTIAYRVVSDDGHPVEGQLHFELAVPAPGTTAVPAVPSPSPAAPSVTSPAVTSPSSSAGSPAPVTTGGEPAAGSTGSWSAWNWLMIAALILLASAVSIVVRRRLAAGRNTRSTDE